MSRAPCYAAEQFLVGALRRSSFRKRRRQRRKVNGVASDVLFTALLQSQLVAYPATSHRHPAISPPSSAIPRSRLPFRGSSTSARRTVKSQPLATLAEVPLSRASFHPLDVSSSRFFSPQPSFLLLLPAFLPFSRACTSPPVVNSRSREIANRNRPRSERGLGLKRRGDAGGKKTWRILSRSQNKQSGVRERTSPFPPRSRALYLSSSSGDTVIFFENGTTARCRTRCTRYYFC